MPSNHWAVTRFYWVWDERQMERHKNINAFDYVITSNHWGARERTGIYISHSVSSHHLNCLLKPKNPVKVCSVHSAYNIYASKIKHEKDPTHFSFLEAKLILGSNNLSILMLKQSVFSLTIHCVSIIHVLSNSILMSTQMSNIRISSTGEYFQSWHRFADAGLLNKEAQDVIASLNMPVYSLQINSIWWLTIHTKPLTSAAAQNFPVFWQNTKNKAILLDFCGKEMQVCWHCCYNVLLILGKEQRRI